MIDIDPRVMDSVRRHMPSVAGGEPPPRNGGVLWSVDCGGVLQESKGRDYDIIVGDAIDYMEAYNRQGKMFDYVFGDLTDVPIDATGGETSYVISMYCSSLELFCPIRRPTRVGVY